MKLLKLLLLLFALSLNPILGFAADMININKATAEQMAAGLSGIGPAKAQAIVDYRNKHGAFKTVADLALVKGIGEKTVTKNKAILSISDSGKAKISQRTMFKGWRWGNSSPKLRARVRLGGVPTRVAMPPRLAA